MQGGEPTSGRIEKSEFMSIDNAKPTSLFPKHPSLSTRLVLLVVCAVALAVLLAWYLSRQAIASINASKQNAEIQSAYQAAILEENLFNDIRQTMITLAALPDVGAGDAACGETLARVVETNPQFIKLEVFDESGKLRCSSADETEAEHNFISGFLSEGSSNTGFTLGMVNSGKALASSSLPAVYPIRSNEGFRKGLILASIDTQWIDRTLADYNLPPGTHFLVIDTQDQVLYSQPALRLEEGQLEKFSLPQFATRGSLQKADLKLTGTDNIERVYHVSPLDEEGKYRLSVGIPAQTINAGIISEDYYTLAGLALIAVFSIICAWLGIRLIFGKRIESLIAANERLASGDGSARTGLDYNTDEIGHLAMSFDRLAETLETNKYSLETESAARIATEQRYRRLFRDAAIGIFQATPPGKLIDVNPAYARLFGYGSPEEAITSIVDVTQLYVYPEKRQDIVDSMVRNRCPVNVDIEYRRKDGSHFIGNLHSWAVFDNQDQLEMLEGSIEDVTAQKESRDVITRQVEQLSSLRMIDLAIGTNLDLKVTLNIILEQATTHLHVDAACIYLYNPVLRTLNYTLGRGFHLGDYQTRRAPFSSAKTEMQLLEEMSVRVPDVTCKGSEFNPPERFWEEKFVAYISLPLIAKGQIKGVLEVFNRQPLEMHREWIDYLNNLAAQTAVAIDSSELFTNLKRSNIELRQAYDATIEGWSRALDLRDHETNDHTMRTADITVRLAQAFGISDADLVQIRWGALLHDIGKMAIPDSILNKPGPLNDDEWTIMRKHPVYARDMLATIDFLQPALEIPYCHHEKWNGDGYPRRLKGKVIPLSARIFSVVDVWDALRSDRPYRQAWPEDQIRAHIKKETGSHFDPEVVEAFSSWLDTSGEYCN